jgi:F-type H+-transporting ATPase subunit b
MAATSAIMMLASATEGLYFGDLGQAVVAVIIFLLLLAVLGRWAWRPIITQLQQREFHVNDTLKQAERTNEEAVELKEHYERRLDKVEDEARRLLDNTRRTAQASSEEILAQARRDAERLLAEAQVQIRQARLDSRADLEVTTVNLATDLAERMLEKQLDVDLDRDELLSRSLEAIGQRIQEERQ